MEDLKSFGSIFGDENVINNTHLELYLRNNVGNFISIKKVKVTGKSNNRVNSGPNIKVNNELNFIDLDTNKEENVVYSDNNPQWITNFNELNDTFHGMDSLKYTILKANGGKKSKKSKKTRKSKKNRRKSKRRSRR